MWIRTATTLLNLDDVSSIYVGNNIDKIIVNAILRTESGVEQKLATLSSREKAKLFLSGIQSAIEANRNIIDAELLRESVEK